MFDTDEELLSLTRRLLDAIAAADWDTYCELCDPTLTCFEPEARGHLVDGLGFHRYYFELGSSKSPRNTTMVAPHVRHLSDDVALVCYVRLVQYLDAASQPHTARFEETRLWQRQSGIWKHVHFHRSQPG